MSDSVVYYIRRGGLIKIGWSGNLASRLRALRPDELLAAEPGCLHLETGRHHQFAEHRLPSSGDGDEWFSPEPELLAHIELIARMYPTPDLAALMPPRTRGRRPRQPTASRPALHDGLAILERAAATRERDVPTMTDDEMASAIHDGEAIFTCSSGWVGRLVAELRRRDMSWADCSRLTGLPPTTLRNRVAKFEEDSS